LSDLARRLELIGRGWDAQLAQVKGLAEKPD
jgi:hypothetical protein